MRGLWTYTPLFSAHTAGKVSSKRQYRLNLEYKYLQHCFFEFVFCGSWCDIRMQSVSEALQSRLTWCFGYSWLDYPKRCASPGCVLTFSIWLLWMSHSQQYCHSTLGANVHHRFSLFCIFTLFSIQSVFLVGSLLQLSRTHPSRDIPWSVTPAFNLFPFPLFHFPVRATAPLV